MGIVGLPKDAVTLDNPLPGKSLNNPSLKMNLLRFGVQIARDSHSPRTTYISHVGAV